MSSAVVARRFTDRKGPLRRGVRDDYEVDDAEPLGRGGFSTVTLGRHKTTGRRRAIKSVDKWSSNETELEIMERMDHPHIIKLFEVFEARAYTHMVMELCSGGELFDRVVACKRFSEVDAAEVSQQILQAATYMHEHHIAHRDLKPENFLFLRDEAIQGNTLKLIDFGTACYCEPGQELSTKVGTPYYVAPEVLSGRYDKQCDLWSIGAIVYILLSGRPPFQGETDQETLGKVSRGQWAFEGQSWEHVSEEAQRLISQLLSVCPVERITAQQALAHDWIRLRSPRGSSGRPQLGQDVLERIQSFNTQNMLKKAALKVAAGQLSNPKSLSDAFKQLDINGDGTLSTEDITDVLETAGHELSDGDVRALVAGLRNCCGDPAGQGESTPACVVRYTEFLAAALDRSSDLTDEVLHSAFDAFDADGDGKITRGDLLSTVCGRWWEARALLRQVDTKKDGEIDLGEFMVMMRHDSAGKKEKWCSSLLAERPEARPWAAIKRNARRLRTAPAAANMSRIEGV